jgi:speckle-type POZ protein
MQWSWWTMATDEVKSELETERMWCVLCQEEYETNDSGTCNECCEEANETKEELKREIKDLNAKVAFLKFWSLLDRPPQPWALLHQRRSHCDVARNDCVLNAQN